MDDVTKLNSLRNDFIHFIPGGFSLEVSSLPRIVAHAVEAIKHLPVEHPTFDPDLEYELAQPNRDRIKKALAHLRVQVTDESR